MKKLIASLCLFICLHQLCAQIDSRGIITVMVKDDKEFGLADATVGSLAPMR